LRETPRGDGVEKCQVWFISVGFLLWTATALVTLPAESNNNEISRFCLPWAVSFICIFPPPIEPLKVRINGWFHEPAISLDAKNSVHQLNPTSPEHRTPTMSTPTPSATPELSASSPDPLATSIQSLLDPSIRATTQKLSAVFLAQQELSGELERLVDQLQHYLDTTEPPELRRTVVKLVETKKRLAGVNSSLQTLQQRINRVYLVLSKARAAGS